MDPYSTHLPVLRFVGRHFFVGKVLELGMGLYSTPLFLDRGVFPDLLELVSVERDAEWCSRVSLNDPRQSLQVVPDECMTDFLTGFDFHGTDLILVDNAVSMSVRAETILRLSTLDLGGAAVVIHDFDTLAYQLAARGFSGRLVYRDLTPWTALVWHA